MIVLMNNHNCRKYNVDEHDIVNMEELQNEDAKRVYPYTRLHLVNEKEKHDFYLDVVESKNKILRLIEEAKLNERSKKT